MRALHRTLGVVLLVTVAVGAAADAADAGRSESLLRESRENVRLALGYLATLQKEDGSWQSNPAITALVITGMMGSGQKEYSVDSPVVAKGLAYIRGNALPNGGIYRGGYANYSTSICVMALIEAGQDQDKPLLKKARAFLLGLQADEAENLTENDIQYGGWGYEQHAEKPGMHGADMSNTQLAIEALARLQEVAEEDKWDAGVGEGEKTATQLSFDKALKFLARCQNLKTVNDQPRTSDDGGFRYRPNETRADGQVEGRPLRSYGSISYAGAKSLLYARLAKDDPRVVAAFEWLSDRWTVKENPGLGQQSLYYYYMTMARCLNVYGKDVIADAEGQKHDWRTELVQQLMNIQKPDHSWRNTAGRWMERLPELTTSYAVLAIEQCWAGW